ncbi:hypothetical protein ABZV81_35700 [Streptomyces parvus]|uniref:hypothetical protein n=1 Tax=Streptomyces parvus TaxID=66428 RepID=UPI0033A2180A
MRTRLTTAAILGLAAALTTGCSSGAGLNAVTDKEAHVYDEPFDRKSDLAHGTPYFGPEEKWNLPPGSAITVECRVPKTWHITDPSGANSDKPNDFLKISYDDGGGYVESSYVTITSRDEDTNSPIRADEVETC